MPPIQPHHDTLTLARYLTANQARLLADLAGVEGCYLIERPGRGWLVEYTETAQTARKVSNSTVISLVRCGIVKQTGSEDSKGGEVWYVISDKGRAAIEQRKRLPKGLLAK